MTRRRRLKHSSQREASTGRPDRSADGRRRPGCFINLARRTTRSVAHRPFQPMLLKLSVGQAPCPVRVIFTHDTASLLTVGLPPTAEALPVAAFASPAVMPGGSTRWPSARAARCCWMEIVAAALGLVQPGLDLCR